MLQNANSFLLEISKNGDLLSMSIHESNSLSSTIKHYSQLHISPSQINRLCAEATSILKNSLIKKQDDPTYINQLKKIGQLLWDNLFTNQIKDRLSTSSTVNLVLSLDEELIYIPWEFLFDGENFLCLKFNLGRLVRAKTDLRPVQYRGKSSVPRMLILANPTNDLKSAYLEGINIRNQFDRKRKSIKIDFKSSSADTFFVKKFIRDYDIIHFAGHCEYDEKDYRNTGWLLSDAIFSIRDIHALFGSSLSMPGLVFSNSCHSAEVITGSVERDYQEKTYSLAAAFLFSGVRHYIGATWKIEDAASFLFAREFYGQMIKAKSIGESVRLARLRLIKELGFSNLNWAGYILYGDPSYAFFHKPNTSAGLLKVKNSIIKRKEFVKKAAFILVLLVIFTYFYTWLPFKNPSSMFLLAESKKLLKKGQNQKVIIISEKIISKDPLFLEAYPLKALAYERIGDKDNALRCYFDYVFCSQKRNDFKSTAKAYIDIGWLYHLYGQYQKAFDFYNKALVLSRKHNDKLNEASSLRKLAVWNIDRQEYDQALEFLMKASEINRDRLNIYEHRYNLACDYFDIGLVFTDKDDFDTAKQFYQKSKDLFDKLKLKNELSDYYFNTGEIYLMEKQYEKALKYYFRGLEIDRAQNNITSIASGYNMIAELYLEIGDLTQAEKYLCDALKILESIKVWPDLAAVYYNLGILEKERLNREKSRRYLRQALEIYKEIDPLTYKKLEKEI